LSDSKRTYYRDEHFMLDVGNRIQGLMKEKSITHEKFFHDTSINPHRLIVGKKNMTISTFKKICDYLEVSPEEFFK